MNLDSLYQDIILDHYKHPHGAGLREPFNVEVTHVNPTCGDEIVLRVNTAGNLDVSYAAEGCSISQASASVMFDLVQNKSVEQAMTIMDEFTTLMHSRGQIQPNEETLEDGVAFAGVAQFPARVKCALLSWMALKDAISQRDAKEL